MADTTKMLPIKKLVDVGGNYYPLTTTETVVFAQDCEVVNNIGAYKKGDKIYVGTSVKTVLENILGRPVAFNIITTTFDTLSDKTAPSSLLTKTEFDKKEKEIQENKAEIEDIKTDISQKFEKMNKTFDTEDNKYIKGFTQVDGELTEIREETLPDKSKVSIETIKLDGGISAILTIDGVAHNIYVPNVDNEFGDEPSTENAASSKLVKDSLDTKQDTIVWRNDNYDKDKNKAVTESDLNTSLYKICHQRGEFASPDAVDNPVDGDIISCGNYYYIYSNERKKWLQLNQNNDYPVKGTITGDHIVVDSIQQNRIKGLEDDIGICKAKSKVEIDKTTLVEGTPIATIKIDDVPTVIKAPSIETCVTTSVTSSNPGEVVIFSNDKGNIIKSSGYVLEQNVTTASKLTDTTYSLTDKEIEILTKLGEKIEGYLVSKRQCDEIDKVDGINTTVSDHTKSIGIIDETVSDHTKSIATNTTNITELDNKIDLRETIEDHNKDITIVNKDISTLTGIVDTMSTNITDMDKKVDKMETTVNSFNTRVTTVETKIDNKQDKLSFITDYDYYTNKVATQKDIKNINGFDRFLGTSETPIRKGETDIPTIDGVEVIPEDNNIVIYGNKKFIWSDDSWQLFGSIASTYFLGISDTPIKENESDKPIIDGEEVTPEKNDIVIYGNKEFIWVDNIWNIFGSVGDFILKDKKAVTNEDVEDGALNILKINGLQTALDNTVTLSTEQTVTGNKTFTSKINVSELVYDTKLTIYKKNSDGTLKEMMKFDGETITINSSKTNPINGTIKFANSLST